MEQLLIYECLFILSTKWTTKFVACTDSEASLKKLPFNYQSPSIYNYQLLALHMYTKPIHMDLFASVISGNDVVNQTA